MNDDLLLIKDSLKVSLRYTDDNPMMIIMYLKGFLDTYNALDFQKEISNVIVKGHKHVIFECSELNYISSVGIGVFTTLLKQLRMDSGDLVLVGLQPKVYDIFQLLGFSKFFNIVDDIDMAKESFYNMDISKNPELSYFPTVVKCPHCKKNLKATKSGRFKCSQCKKVLSIDDSAHVSFS